MIHDLRFAIRSLARSRVFVVVAIASLGIGIGADTAVFSLVDAVLFRPLSFPASEQLVDMHEWSATQLCAGCNVGTSYDTYSEWRRNATAFESIGAYQEIPAAISVAGTAERVGGALASASMFNTLGARASIGRTFSEGEDRIGGPAIVVLSNDLWLRRFNADSGIVGHTIRVNGVARTVIGVMPSDFHFPEFATLWVPFEPEVRRGARDDREIGVIGRLRPGATVVRANAQMATLAAGVAKEHPETNREWTAQVTPLRDSLSGTEAQLFVILLGAISLVLLIVCANLAGLLLARGAARRREIAIRLALGASRGRVIQTLLTESTILAIAGGGLGILIAWWAVDLTASRFHDFVPYWMEFRVDGRVLAFSAVTSILAGLAFGLLPAMRAASPNVQDELKDGAQNASAGRARTKLRGALVIGELSIALVLLAAAGMLVKSFLRISVNEPGVDQRRLVTAQLEFLDARYANAAQLRVTSDAILQRIAGLPNVDGAALAHTEFLAGFGARDRKIHVEGISDVSNGVSPRFVNAVTPGYFRAQGLTLARGREFSASDRPGGVRVVIINERLARDLWPHQDPLGKRIKLSDSSDASWLTVVGVTRDPAGARQAETPRPTVFVPLAQWLGRPISLVVRTGSEQPLRIAPALRRAIAEVDPDLPVVDLMTAEQAHERNYWPYKLYAIVMSSFAGLAVLLAVLGVYGIVAYGVEQRTREIGIRVALGAERRDVIRLVTSQGLRLALSGIVLGLGLSTLVLRVMQSLLFGASPMDPLVLALVSALIAASAVVASFFPANRAAKVDPANALRFE